MSVTKERSEKKKSSDDYEPPVLTNPQHGKFLDSEAVYGVQNQFLTLEEAAHAAKLAYPDAQGVTMEIVDNMQIFTIRQAGPLVMVPESMMDNYTTWMLKEKKVVNRLNTHFRNWLNNLNGLFQFISFLGICLSIYVFAADWGDLDPAFFNGIGAISFLFSFTVFCVVYIGDKGITYQLEKRDNVDWWKQGVPLIRIYLVLFVAFWILLLFMFSVSVGEIEDIRMIEAVLSAGGDPPAYSYSEGKIAEKFNPFFFGARSSEFCPDMKYYWMWLILNDICDYGMTMPACSVCYGATICEADQGTCVARQEAGEWDDVSCPYNACRQQILSYMISYIDIIAWCVFGFLFYWTLLLAMTFGLVCYNPRDKYNKMQVKLGIKPSAESKRHILEQTVVAAAGGGSGGANAAPVPAAGAAGGTKQQPSAPAANGSQRQRKV
jgi:hypothetical protein